MPCHAPLRAGFQGVVEFVFQGGNKAFPLRAPPAIVHGDFTLWVQCVCACLRPQPADRQALHMPSAAP